MDAIKITESRSIITTVYTSVMTIKRSEMERSGQIRFTNQELSSIITVISLLVTL